MGEDKGVIVNGDAIDTSTAIVCVLYGKGGSQSEKRS